MAQFVNMFEVDLRKPTGPQPLRQMVAEGDAKGNRVGAIVTDDGAAVALGGSCVGKVVRADGATVPLTGTISGNQAYVVLDQASCAVEGPIQVAVCWVSGTNVTTLVVAYGTVVHTQTGNAVQPSTPIPDLAQLLAEIDEMREATAAAEAIVDSLEDQWPFFDISKQEAGVYIDGDGHIAQGNLYRLSDFIPVIPGQAYRVSAGTLYYTQRNGGFYDANKTFISRCMATTVAQDGGPYIFVAPKDAAYVRICYMDTNEGDVGVTLISPENVITPEMFGATGDGVTDDRPAFLLLVNALAEHTTTSRTVLCLGTYVIGNTIEIPEGCGLINFVGLDSRAYVSTFQMIRRQDESVFPMFNIRDTGVNFNGITFKGVESDPVSPTAGAGVGIIYNLQTSTASLNGNIDAHIVNCEFVTFATAVRVYGQNLRIEGCMFSRCLEGISYVSVDADYACELKGFVIQNNRFHQLRTAIVNMAALQGGILRRSTLITGNLADIVFRFYSGYGTNLTMIGNAVTYTPTGGNSQVNLLDEGLDSYCLISNNTFDAAASATSNPSCNTCIASETPVVITNNLFKNSAQHGVNLSGDANGSKVSSNVFRGCGGSTYYAIDLETVGNIYFINDNLTGTANGNDGIGGEALATSVLSNNYVGVIS